MQLNEQLYQAMIDEMQTNIAAAFREGKADQAKSLMLMRDALEAVRKERDDLRFRMDGLEK